MAKRRSKATRKAARPAPTWFDSNYDILIALGVAVIVFGLVLSTYPTPPAIHDAYTYIMSAQRLLRDGMFALSPELPGTEMVANARVTPGHIVFLAGLYAVTGSGQGDVVEAVKQAHPLLVGVQLCFGLVAVGFIALTGRELGGRRMGLVAGVLAALSASFPWAATVALAESLGVMLIAIQLYLCIRFTRADAQRTWRGALAIGLVTAAVVMVRPAMSMWVLIPAAYALVRRLESPKRALMLVAVAAAGVVLVFAPWWVRNASVIGTFVPLRTELVRDNGQLVPAAPGYEEPFDAASGLQQRVSVAWTSVWEPWIAPLDILFENATHYDEQRIAFSDFEASVLGQPFLVSMQLAKFYQHFIVLAYFAAVFFVRRSPRLVIPLLTPIYVMGVHFSSRLNERYMFLAMPAMIVCAAAGAIGVYLFVSSRLAARGGSNSV